MSFKLHKNSSRKGLVNEGEFKEAASTKGGCPDSACYNAFVHALYDAGISTRNEATLFLAHTIWESDGFKATREYLSQTDLPACLRAYPNNAGGCPGKVYYGRGFMQLTWDYNYKEASQVLFGNDTLLQNPDLVADDVEISWATAAWFWRINVHDEGKGDTFQSSLGAINGVLEPPDSDGYNQRLCHYKEVIQKIGGI